MLGFGILELLGGFLLKHSAISGVADAAFGESILKGYFAGLLLLVGTLTLLAGLVILIINNYKNRKPSRS